MWSSRVWMRSCRNVRASDWQCQSRKQCCRSASLWCGSRFSHWCGSRFSLWCGSGSYLSLMRIRIITFNFMRIRIQIISLTLDPLMLQGFHLFTLMLIWIQLPKMMRIHQIRIRNTSRNSPGFDPSILRHGESERQQMRQCWKEYIKNVKSFVLKNYRGMKYDTPT